MSRYLILVLLNLPLILAAIIGSLVDFKTRKITQQRFFVQIGIWLVVLLGLASAYFIYNGLKSHDLTQTTSMNLFDVIQFTGITYLLFMLSRARSKVDILEQKIDTLHRELSIRLSRDEAEK